MLGNHGPAYYQRYPPAFRRFTPTCDTEQLGHCSQREIVNSYDNAVLYTGHVLARTINLLKDQPGYDTALVYVSDHGESLGENRLYLPGVPRAIAPTQPIGSAPRRASSCRFGYISVVPRPYKPQPHPTTPPPP